MKITVDDVLKNTPKEQIEKAQPPKMINVELEKFQRLSLNNQMMAKALEKVLQEKTEILFEMDGKTFGACIVEPEPNRKSLGFFQLVDGKHDAGAQ